MSQQESPAIAAEVRAFLARRQVRQSELAKILGLKQSGVSRRLAGTIDFSGSELLTIARHYDVDVDTFMPAEEIAS